MRVCINDHSSPSTSGNKSNIGFFFCPTTYSFNKIMPTMSKANKSSFLSTAFLCKSSLNRSGNTLPPTHAYANRKNGAEEVMPLTTLTGAEEIAKPSEISAKKANNSSAKNKGNNFLKTGKYVLISTRVFANSTTDVPKKREMSASPPTAVATLMPRSNNNFKRTPSSAMSSAAQLIYQNALLNLKLLLAWCNPKTTVLTIINKMPKYWLSVKTSPTMRNAKIG